MSFSTMLLFSAAFVLLFVFTESTVDSIAAPQRRSSSRHAPPVASKNDYYQLNLLGGVLGPESLAFDCNGKGPYAGVSDGRILRWRRSTQSWVEFAVTSPHRNRKLCDGTTEKEKESICGRPLGLKFHPKSCELYIADAYFGLLKVGSDGGVATQLANSAEGVPLKFTNDLDINSDTGVVYFTDSSTYYERRNYNQIIDMGDKSGRLLKYDPATKKVTVLHRGLAFPNGIALSKNNSYLLLAESTNFQILKFSLSKHHHKSAPQIFASIDKFADNIRRTKNGEFWVALNGQRNPEVVSEVPVGIKFDEHGRIIKTVNGDDSNTLEWVSQVEEHNGRLWFGSQVRPYVGTMKYS
ncbi:protein STRICTOSIDINE SYNTHASE-LIKE 10-like [Mercurialis annua]|uniref:protein STRICTOSIDINE SYNTHASE-LIKE 10-like n=1 Tax=Mercurialis annua TaxID=3986 RepID=UPI00215EFA68|nr:protein STRICTOSIDINE SYNTHASE-LIKE 10-like [Mercurialis annua]